MRLTFLSCKPSTFLSCKHLYLVGCMVGGGIGGGVGMRRQDFQISITGSGLTCLAGQGGTKIQRGLPNQQLNSALVDLPNGGKNPDH